MTYQPLEFAAVSRPYRLGNDQLRRYNRVRSGQQKQGRINLAIDIVTVLLIVSLSTVVAIVELSSMPDPVTEKLAALTLSLLLGGGLILLALLTALIVVEAAVRVQVLGVDRTATAAARAGPVDAPGPGP